MIIQSKLISGILSISMLLIGIVFPNNNILKNTNQFKEKDIQLQTSTGTIYGTVTLPKSDTTVPVVLIIAGSGPTDRNCNSVDGSIKSDSYKMIAAELAKKGIASDAPIDREKNLETYGNPNLNNKKPLGSRGFLFPTYSYNTNALKFCFHGILFFIIINFNGF